jgi:hypothetical protein
MILSRVERISMPFPPVTAEPLGRPVSHADPASYQAGPRLKEDGRPHPDYGCVFWTDQSDYQGAKYRYDYSRDGWCFCLSGRGQVIPHGWLNLDQRAHRIAGPSDRQLGAA